MICTIAGALQAIQAERRRRNTLRAVSTAYDSEGDEVGILFPSFAGFDAYHHLFGFVGTYSNTVEAKNALAVRTSMEKTD